MPDVQLGADTQLATDARQGGPAEPDRSADVPDHDHEDRRRMLRELMLRALL